MFLTRDKFTASLTMEAPGENRQTRQLIFIKVGGWGGGKVGAPPATVALENLYKNTRGWIFHTRISRYTQTRCYTFLRGTWQVRKAFEIKPGSYKLILTRWTTRISLSLFWNFAQIINSHAPCLLIISALSSDRVVL